MRKIFILIFICLVCHALYTNNDLPSNFGLITDNNPLSNNTGKQTLTFSQAADLAVAASADLRHSRSSQKIMEKAWLSGMWQYLPKFSVSVSENDRLQRLGADSFTKNYGISVDQLLFDGGRLLLSRNIEKTELKLSSSKLNRMSSEIAEAAISAYRNVLSSRAILEIKNSALIVLKDQLNIMNEEVQLGLALPVDLSNAQINLADAKIEILSLQLDLIEIERQFAEILGLNELPLLIEKVDINRACVLPNASAASTLAREQNPDLIEARYAITKKEAELSYLSRSWIPSFRLAGTFGLSGDHYPLTRYNWSVGINIELNSPWIQNRFGFQAGWEPPHDRSAALQNNFTPFNDPSLRFGRKQAKLSLALEREKYETAFNQAGRMAANAVEKCRFAEEKRLLALEASIIGEDRCRVEKIRHDLGQITRLDLMEVLIQQTQREITAVEAATFLLEAERELERFLDIRPGELAVYAAAHPSSVNESN